ncbi:trypsin-like serine protease [Clavibacter michiganensis]|uniref:trypsin-like serine protease n=1 Tax=Clavibacter michiganensis TaxID=28447 RepID=UPI0026DA8057|nr:trypsin-like serine protease [Clavibacter michiganensis]MDO4036470.1 trypsin-like serine protease [Clavibacter michiganensis]MDO4048856.1 trypsin-like serine protease [Clavibacter michiganensis]MDO4076358.1 trypsin-like serine protease [Clavibacter michiganensis]MDO4107147.1 trypsin-like serine protease [Clavibacter michiganensis]
MAVQASHAAQARHTRGVLRRQAAILLTVVAVLTGTLNYATPAQAVTIPSNPDRIREPVVAGSKVNTPTGSCTVGAVLIPRSIYSRITPYQRATRWFVIAKHCARMYAPIHVGTSILGDVVWQSATSDIELVRVSPRPDPSPLICVAHHPKNPAVCSPFQTFTARAAGQVFMTARGHVARLPVTGSGAADDDRFCTSGWSTGVQCIWHGVSIPPRTPLSYEHLVAGESGQLLNLDPGDSGGPVVNYSAELLGIISSILPRTTLMLYTPMSQVLSELHDYQLASGD